MDAVTQTPAPKNEPVLTYAPGSAERAELEGALKRLGQAEPIDLTVTVGGEQRLGAGEKIEVVQPHNHRHVIGTIHSATQQDAADAIAAAAKAAPEWRALSYDDRAAILLRAADLLTGKWRATLNAATMLGQSKTATQAEIDAACELADFWRFNVEFGRRVLAEQPISSPGVWNRMEHRPLEGFVYAITPFNFTAIAGNLPTAPALMGNTVLWKPSPTQSFAAHLTMRLLEEAGMPPGVINLLPGDGKAVSEVALTHRDLAGIHFTGSTATFQHLWATVGANIAGYRGYPRLVGETGGKDFVLAHAVRRRRRPAHRAGPRRLRVPGPEVLRRFARLHPAQRLEPAEGRARRRDRGAVLRRCHRSVALRRRGDRPARVHQARRSCSSASRATPRWRSSPAARPTTPTGYFVQPTILVSDNPKHEIFSTEYFGPILSVHVYEDGDFDAVLKLVDETAAYALTGAIIANDRTAVAKASEALRFAAGNFYVNDKPTGAVVGQQPFGGARASGTNDKAGSIFNLQRWTSPRSVKETFVAPTSVRYPHQG